MLLVEDDANLRFGVAAALRAAGLAVDEAVDLPQADEALFVTAYDCAVFDRMLPSGDAAAYVEELRRGGRAVPVLFLTARDTVADRVEGFARGGDDDLRTPAASLRTLAETALRGETDSTDVHRRTLRLAEGMGTLVDGLLTRARLMSGTAVLAVEPLRLDQLVEAVVEDAAGEGQRVAVRAERAVVVVADPDLVRRAVANLVGNALVHGHRPGEPAEVEVTVDSDGATTTVTVEDAGPGLPPEVAGALFDRFRSGAGSTGLGLSIASWVAHAHGGSLTAEAGRRGGARFVLRLPPGGPATEG
ncbi:response regulator [Streptomyces arboris]|uniref:histidine kinase n=1 Tax=Streptomyces arboris TaxID=2600619 RepID=A0A5N5EUF0_9ACTN|nr:response regulator [Streptomyces arboris]